MSFADPDEPRIFLLLETEQRIVELDLTNPGDTTPVQAYDLSGHMPHDGSQGAEGLTFVPNEALRGGGFVDAAGNPAEGRGGLGGLMWVGHQNGGGIYVFDLVRETGEVIPIGTFGVVPEFEGKSIDPGAEDPGNGFDAGSPIDRVVGLEFERSLGRLYVWHGLEGRNVLSVVGLGSRPTSGSVPTSGGSDVGALRALEVHSIHRGPSARRIEGLALTPPRGDGSDLGSLFVTVDDGGQDSLFEYREFTPGAR